MMEGLALSAIRAVVALLGAAVVVAMVTDRVRVPYTMGLVLLGLAVAIVHPGLGALITPSLVLPVLLPGLSFEAAFRIDVVELRPTLAATAGSGSIERHRWSPPSSGQTRQR